MNAVRPSFSEKPVCCQNINGSEILDDFSCVSVHETATSNRFNMERKKINLNWVEVKYK